MNKLKLDTRCQIMTGFAVCVLLILYWVFWGKSLLATSAWISPWPLLVIPLSIAPHEALHGLGFMVFAKAPLASLRFGYRRKPRWVLCAWCTTPMTMGAYQWATALPALVLAVVPCFVGLASNNPKWAVWGMLNFLLINGDLAILLRCENEPTGKIIRIREAEGLRTLFRGSGEPGRP